ncbi:hypothetical protein FE257_000002 [Aspergillus nanangensis]|uniref:Yeast cell wall synthesis Kre9/Knh1-like N-terminal domain-containing protein n=1 Tax=Aspergillus nanangensis TaxID=2582783 RepID=A0AAD4CYJ5_ASPNN|nr:hypothetical protein FE257_000002 [Aspergillus nanangensis]
MRLFGAFAFSTLVALATAYTDPDYSQNPSGNPILKPGLGELVAAGEPYTITWTPTTKGPISLVLLRGPSENVRPIDTLADAIPNSGSFSWTPSASLKPDTTHYGLLLVVEGTGQYQYSTQFGIKNPEYVPPSGSTSSTSESTPTTSSTSMKPTTTTTTSASSSTTKETTSTHPEPTTTSSSSSSSSSSASVPETTETAEPTKTSHTKPVESKTSHQTPTTASVVESTTPSATPTPSSDTASGAARLTLSFAAIVVGVAAFFI